MSTIESYHGMIISKYFKTIKDFINLEFVCKKFSNNMKKFHFNPIPLNCKTLEYFSNIETLHLWQKEDENFDNGFIVNMELNEDHKENEIYQDINTNKTKIFKKAFYNIVVWFSVDFETVDKNKGRNIQFKNVTFTENNRKKYGNNIPFGITTIYKRCFYECSSLSSVSIPTSVTSIGEGCFYKCK
ncbi:hypothetical protein EIN_349310, partial [Entamoeba invadens IP1]